MTDDYSEAIRRLAELGQAKAAYEKVSADRDERIWGAHKVGVSKAEIGRITGYSWATIDRAVRDMEAKEAGQ